MIFLFHKRYIHYNKYTCHQNSGPALKTKHKTLDILKLNSVLENQLL